MSSDHALLLADQAARAAALDVTRSLIVQAPAGSGKTELLIQRYLVLLATVDNPEEVLAITFTLKAAAEMRLRVANALLQAEHGEEVELPHQKVTRKAALKVLVRDKELDWRLLESPRRMRIQTLDAFSAGIARSLPVSSGLGQVGHTVVDEEMHALHRTAAAATLDWLDSNDERKADIERVLAHLDNNTAIYIRYVSRMLAARDQWIAMVGGEKPDETEAAMARARIEDSIEKLVTQHLEQIRSRIPSTYDAECVELVEFAAKNLAAENREHPLVCHAQISRLPRTEAAALSDWRSLASLFLVKDGNWRKIIDKRDGFPADKKEHKKRLYALISELRELRGLRELLHRLRVLPTAKYSDEQWSVLLALFEVLRVAAGELHQLFDQRGLSDHTEVSIAAGTALGTAEQPSDMALMLDYGIQHILVDEMQDTSVGQYELLEKLTAGWEAGDGRTMLCVGDPMQSIYRFRDADVGRFMRAQRVGVGALQMDSLTLRQNFRSGEHLVHWFNTVFSQIMPDADDLASGTVAYSDSVPVEMHQGDGDWSIHPLIDASPDEEAEVSLQLVSSCNLTYPDDSKAMLVRSRTHLTALLPKLRAAGIAYQAIEIDRLTDLPEIIDVLALTRALCHEADRLAWLAILRGPWVGLTWRDLHALVRNDSRSTVSELISDASRQSSLSETGQLRLSQFAAKIERHCGCSAVTSLRDRVEAAWFDLGGPALLGNAVQLENVYRYFDVVDGLANADTMTDISELERQLDGERVSTVAESSSQLQIMTMHKAKGLEFDHVFLPGLGRVPRARQKSVLSWLGITGEDQRPSMIISPVGAQSELANDPLHQFIEDVEKEKDKSELDRLLYVACTRARKSLHLVGNVRSTDTGLRTPESSTLLFRLWPVIAGDFERALEGHSVRTTGDDLGPALVDPILRRLRHAWQTPDIKPLPVNETIDESEALMRPVDYYWVGSAARHAGTIIHQWLQQMTRSPRTLAESDIDMLEATNKSLARQLGVPKNQIAEVCERVALALRNTLQDDKGRWLLEGNGHAEFAITGLRAGNLRSIVIDRIRIDDDGTHWIVDYKSSTHEGGDLQEFLGHESDRYREQLGSYREIYSQLVDAPVKTALYFPLLQQFCEVDSRG